MSYTISDFYNTFKEHLQLIAGSGGMSHQISDCGILDYELMPELKESYLQSNFQKDQLILSTMVYTRNNPYGILDAIKHLVSKGASGLVIKNVFRIPIQEAIIRYADAKNFPVFLIPARGMELSFEEVIYTVNRRSELKRDLDYRQDLLNHIVNQPMENSEIRSNAIMLNPSFHDRFFSIYIKPDEFISEEQKVESIYRFQESEMCSYEDFIGPSREGIYIVKSSEHLQNFYTDHYIDGIIDLFRLPDSTINYGISDMHNTLNDFKLALEESFMASKFQEYISSDKRRFSDLGSYRLLMHTCTSQGAETFMHSILDDIDEYDSINHTQLMTTLEEYAKADCDLEKTANVLSQHEQTIRYRLNRIYDITNLNKKSYSDTEQLILACKLNIARKILS